MRKPLNPRPDGRGRLPPREASPDGSGKLQLVEEALQVSKQQVVTGTVRVSTTTETHQEMAEVSLEHSVVDVIRVPIGKMVEVAPQVRTENGTTIVPVLEERFVVVKQLFLKEELHIRQQVEREVSRTAVALRRQVASIERIDAPERVADDDIRRVSIAPDEAPVLES